MLGVITANCLRFLVGFAAPGLDLWLALLALPFVFSIEHRGATSIRYGILSLISFALYSLLYVQSLFFLGFCSFILFIIESTLGKASIFPIIMALLISPAVNYLTKDLGFPLRVKLSWLAAKLLGLVAPETYSLGNQVFFRGEPFTIEPACLGLRMMVSSIIMALSILAWFQIKQRRKSKPISIMLWLGLTSGLVIAANLFRIMLLVVFRVPPESAAHDLLGLMCILFYVCLPLWYISLYFVNGKNYQSQPFQLSRLRQLVVILLMTGILAISAYGGFYYEKTGNEATNVQYPKLPLQGFAERDFKDGIKQYRKAHEVVYVKPCRSFYHSTHTPTICWRGNGFELSNEKTFTINQITVLTAHLNRKDETLYTAWWYQGEGLKTIDQWAWRKQMLVEKTPFALVNVTADSEQELHALLSHILE